MMREPATRRDQREIAIPSDARPPLRRRPAPNAAPRRGWATGLAVAGAGISLCRRRPGEVFAVLVALAAVGAVSINALGSQKGRHPAPILANLSPRPSVLPPRRPSPDKAAEAPAVDARPAVKPETPRQAAKDGIGDLIRASEPARPGDTTASVTPKAAKTDDSVAAAQRALVKLGYGPLKPDGILGAGTRAAISRFERDRKLPVKGEPSPRTLRELAARAGLPPG